ncbi:tetratricopeptide repeat protein [Rhodothermus profundi]|uniref:Tetratricopeptide repeat-containing protein n=1 Tax=Rhodothermus profundi TaxID=633813 RepID=A0A1M6RTW3_9BACT|nr:tetratricopeptide repeat protein [Rhodothermus profundi]SHK35818.1 Tetratricopeptide repeat-containing protein [Rhodothermus profundi]
MRLVLGIALLWLLLADDGARQGRRGNAAYRAERYAEAAELYRQGLLLTQDPAVRFGLQYNLGAALLRLGEAGAARAAFDAALRLASNHTERARAAYNAGNAAFTEGDLQAALYYYRMALLADPDFEDARFNYEYVLRHLPSSPPPSPSGGSATHNDPNNASARNTPGRGLANRGSRENANPSDSQSDAAKPQQPSSTKPGAPPPPSQLSPEAAARLLEALQRQEQEALRRALRLPTTPRKVQKDW